MQTSQVNNTANVLTAPSAPNKQNESNAAGQSFGNVLSREVAQRNSANEAPKNKEAGKASPPQQQQQPAKAAEARSPKTSDAKSAKEGKQADKAQAEEESADASALPEELLALVANLNGLNVPAAEAQPAQATAVTQDAQAAAAAASALSAAVALPDAKAAAESLPTDTRPLAATDLKQDNAALQAKSDGNETKAELPVATATDAVVKAEELNDSALAAGAAAPAKDFKAAMSDSLNGITNAMQPVTQQTGLQAVQQHGANAAERLTPRVGTPAWDQALGQKVVWMVAGEQQSASLTLNPPDLGPLQVVLNVSNSQANATFIAAQPEVRQALEAAMPKLRDMLGEAGIQLGQASVNSGTPNQQGGFEQQGSQSGRGHGQYGNREPEQADAQVRVTRVQPSSSGLGMVDTFA